MTGRVHNFDPSGRSASADGEVALFNHSGLLPKDTWDQLDQIPDATLRNLVSIQASQFVDDHKDPTCKQLVRQLHEGVDIISGQPRKDAPTTKQAITTVLAAAERYSEPEQGQAAIQQVADDIITRYERSKLPAEVRTSWLGGLMARLRGSGDESR